MATCISCGSHDADPDWGQCFACFCLDRKAQLRPDPTEADYCAGADHAEYIEGCGFCYCGAQAYFPALEQAYPNRVFGAVTREEVGNV